MKKLIILSLLIVPIILESCSVKKDVNISYDLNSTIVSYGVSRLSNHLETAGISLKKLDANDHQQTGIFILTPNNLLKEPQQTVLSKHISNILSDGYKIILEGENIYVLGKTDKGCLYGIMDLIEQIGFSNDFTQIEERHVNPASSFRAIKFNLPWSPYRPGPATELHTETCKDLNFWETFLDMMVENRFNAITLWNTHNFPFMIRANNYPEATPFDDDELNEWKTFWKKLFKMAKDRGIETYLVNWNIVVSPEFAENYGAKVHNDRSELVKKYTKESITQLINEYENLTGLGVTLADWMGNWGDVKMTPTEREDWIEETFVEGMKNADRKIKFIHRAVLAGDPKEMRRVIDNADLPEKTIVEVKFNWSHGHSTPNLSLTHSNNEGTIMRDFWEPKPENYFIAWMVRNEDFFVLRWGNPEFIRAHINTNNFEYVDGYFVGSEGYIPAKDYSHKNTPTKTWNYAFEKQWLFYHLWGRLIYNPLETNETLTKAIKRRYKNIDGTNLLKAYSFASNVPLYFASFYKGTWDFTLYSEGFLAPWQNGFDDKKSPFISIEELIKHKTLDSKYLNISEYCRQINDDLQIADELITPLELALLIDEDCNNSMTIINTLRTPENNLTLNSELDDLETWCHLGFYFANKLRAGVSLETFNLSQNQSEKEKSVEYLEKCLGNWKDVIRLTIDRYEPMPYVSFGHHEPRWPEFKAFHWNVCLKDVEADLNFVKNSD